MPHERLHHHQPELAPELVSAYAATFIARFDTYPMQNADGSYQRVKHPLPYSIIEGHLNAHITIGAYALNPDSFAHWICYDADDRERFDQMRQLAVSLASEDIPSYLEQSHRGGHLWLFTSPLLGQDMRRFGRQLLVEHSVDPKTIELYPKQDRLTTGVGSLVRLPLGIHRITHQRYSFLTLDGQYLASSLIDQMRILAEPQRIPQPYLDRVLAAAPEAKPIFPTQPFVKRKKNRIVGDPPSERIKNWVSVYDFVSQYVELDLNGRGYCPYHDDGKMSFSANTKGNYWHCFACKAGGSVIDFWMQWRQLNGQNPDFTESIVDLIQLLNL